MARRGLCGVKLIVADGHAGLKAARSVPWQRCQFHLQQNAQAYVTRLDQRQPVAQRIRALFTAPDWDEAQRLLNQAIELWRKDAPNQDALPLGRSTLQPPGLWSRTAPSASWAARLIRTRVSNEWPACVASLALLRQRLNDLMRRPWLAH